MVGVQKLKPCGTAVAGKLLPREKSPLELVPRVVTTWSDGRSAAASSPAAPDPAVMAMSSIQPLKSAGPVSLS